MKLKFRILKIIILLLAFILLLNFTINQNKERALQDFNILIIDSIDKKFVTNQTILKALKRESNGNIPSKIKDINVEKIEKRLKSNLFIDTANVYLDINGKLTIYIKQKQPILRVHNKHETFYLSDKDEFIPISPNFSYKCILIDGKILADDRIQIINLVKEINNDKLLKNHIIGIKKIKNNSFNLLVNYGGYYIEFGDLENSKQKLENLKQFYIQYLGKMPYGTYKIISLKYNNQIIGIKRNKENEYNIQATKK